MIPIFRFGSERLAEIHNTRVPEWDGMAYNPDGSRRFVYVYPAGMHYTYIVDHGDFTVKSCAYGGLTVPVEIEVIPKRAAGHSCDIIESNN